MRNSHNEITETPEKSRFRHNSKREPKSASIAWCRGTILTRCTGEEGPPTSSIQGVLPLQLQKAFKEGKMPYRLDENSPQHCGTANDKGINDIQRLEIEECAQRRYGEDLIKVWTKMDTIV